MMYKENALALRVALETGLRISDVLSITTEQISKRTFTVREQKTGKPKKCRLSMPLLIDCRKAAGTKYLFPSRCSQEKHRTRQAVSKDLNRVLDLLESAGYIQRITARQLRDKRNFTIGVHSFRKTYVKNLLNEGKDIQEIQHLLNHDRELTTLVYIMAAEIDFKTAKKKALHAAEPSDDQ